MAATKEDIRRWLKEAKDEGATHMIVACDTFDWEDYPVSVKPGEDPEKKSQNLGNMQKFMECYALHLDLEKQLNEHRSYHFEPPPK